MIDLGHPSYTHEFELTMCGFGRTEIKNHARLDIIYMLSGSATVETAYHTYKMEASDYCALNVMELYHIVYSESAQALCFSMAANMLGNPDSRIDFCSNTADITQKDASGIRSYLARSFQLYYRDAERNRYGIYSCMYSVIDVLYKYYAVPDHDASAGRERYEVLEKMLHYIQENASQNLQLGDLAGKFYLSVGHVSRMFQKHLHTTFTEYLREVRLNNAYDLLLNTSQSVTEIAISCGFGSTNRLIEVFSKKYGITPGKFRKRRGESEVLPQLREQTQLFDDLLKHAAEPAPVAPAPRQVEHLHYDVPHPQKGRFREMGFFKLINVGWAKEILYAPVQEQLRFCQREIGFEFIRFHGIFDEDMMVYQENESGEPVYNFTYLDLVYDFILSIGFKPYVEFSYFPKALASDQRLEMLHNSYIYGLPSSMEKWCALVRATIIHWIERYGLKAVRKWLFRTGEGMNLYYRRMALQDYLLLYTETMKTVKSVDPQLQFGGLNLDVGMLTLDTHQGIEAFLKYFIQHDCLPDFYSFQCFHNDYDSDYQSMMRAVVGHGVEPATLSADEDYMANHIRALRRQIRRLDDRSCPILLDTWNASIWQRDLRGDTCFKSAFIFKNMLENVDNLSGFGYWNLSDMFEEVHAAPQLFHGGYGLMTYNGIPKPAFFAFQLLKRLGGSFVQRGSGYFVTNSGNGNVQIALYNYCHYDTLGRQHLFVEGNAANPYEMFQNARARQFDIDLKLPDGEYIIEKYAVSRKGCWGSPYDLWLDMGSPDMVTPEQVEYLKMRARPQYVISRGTSNGGLVLNEVLEPHDVCVITIKPTPKRYPVYD